jgi:exosortase
MNTNPQNVASSSAFSGTSVDWRSAAFGLLAVVPLLACWSLSRRLFALALTDDTFTHIPLIPFISFFLVFSDRRTVFSEVSPAPSIGGGLAAFGALTIGAADYQVFSSTPSVQMSVYVIGLIVFWIGLFAFLWGSQALRHARFALLFLIFMVPIPEPLLSKIIYSLQEWSAEATAVLFNAFGVPYLRNDLIFSLPTMAIRIAEECSGIRSTLALLIMTVLASHLFLRSGYKQLIVCLLVVPLSIFKNGMRIATLSALAVYVDPIFLTGPIHHKFGGMIFFGFAFVPLGLLFYLFRRSEVEHRDLPLSHASS